MTYHGYMIKSIPGSYMRLNKARPPWRESTNMFYYYVK
jgi:hypothetical protein